ncbi:hypothetical protein EXIGLDRAFT_571830, partial [Exidia glandulosa HHB12029]
PEEAAPAPARRSLDAEQLAALAGRVGARVLHAAQGLAAQGKNRVIGDGTSAGYVRAVFEAASLPAPSQSQSFGHLVYEQTGSSVHLRKSDILPGDIVQLHDAKFHGRKGLKSYTTVVEDAVGIVAEFEGKSNAKIKVLKANQSANAYPAVEQASYRLHDLQSGSVKV